MWKRWVGVKIESEHLCQKSLPSLFGGGSSFQITSYLTKPLAKAATWVCVSAYSEDWFGPKNHMKNLIWEHIILPTEWEPFTTWPSKNTLPTSPSFWHHFLLECNIYFPVGIDHFPSWETLKSSRSIWGKKTKKKTILFWFCAIKQALFFSVKGLIFLVKSDPVRWAFRWNVKGQ